MKPCVCTIDEASADVRALPRRRRSGSWSGGGSWRGWDESGSADSWWRLDHNDPPVMRWRVGNPLFSKLDTSPKWIAVHPWHNRQPFPVQNERTALLCSGLAMGARMMHAPSYPTSSRNTYSQSPMLGRPRNVLGQETSPCTLPRKCMPLHLARYAVAASAFAQRQATSRVCTSRQEMRRNGCTSSCSSASTRGPAEGSNTGLTARPAPAPAQYASARRPSPLVAAAAHVARRARWSHATGAGGPRKQQQLLLTAAVQNAGRGNATAAFPGHAAAKWNGIVSHSTSHLDFIESYRLIFNNRSLHPVRFGGPSSGTSSNTSDGSREELVC